MAWNLNKKLWIKAGSLLYAIFISVIIALLIGGLLLVSSLYKGSEVKFESRRQLRLECENLFQEFLASGELKFSKKNSVYVAFLEKKTWGYYNVNTCLLITKNDTLVKSELIGSNIRKSKETLYLADFSKPLKLGGKAIISGDVKMSPFGIETLNIENKPFTGNFPSNKNIKKSNKILPELKKVSNTYDNYIVMNYLEYKSKKITYNPFFKPTIIINCTGLTNINDIKVSGNIVIKSKDSLSISLTAKLTDVIIEAPVVNFETGFVGDVQVFAKKSIFLQKKVTLKFPSILSLYNDSNKESKIKLMEGSLILGAVIVNGKMSIFDNKRTLIIEKNTQIIGQVYCRGNTELKGKITGTIYTNNFRLRTATTSYDNSILDGIISNKEIPADFVNLALLKRNHGEEKKFIKEL